MAENGLQWIYWLIFAIYLVYLAVAGVYAKKKTKTLQDFMVAGRTIGPILLGLSFGVTYFSAVIIVGGGQFAWLWGLGVVWIASLNALVGVFAVFLFFGSRTRALGEEFESLTVPQFLSKRYQDPKLQTFTSVVILFFETIYLVSIYMGLSLLLAVAMPDNNLAYPLAVIICGAITIVYLNIGGAHGAITTDVAESIIMLTGVLCIFIFGLIKIGGFDVFLATLSDIEQSEGMSSGALTTFPGAGGFGLIGFILVTSFGVWGMPQMISRFFTANKRKRTLRWGLVIACSWAFIVAIFAYLNGAIARAYFFKGNEAGYDEIAGQAGATAIPMLMIDTLPIFLAGLFLAAVTAASLTTGEKVIMIAASGFSIDVYQAKTNCSDDKALLVTKITTTVIVMIAVFLAILQPGAVLVLCMFAWAAMASTILVPYIFGLFWKKGTAKAALLSGVIALVGAILWFALFRGADAWAAFGLTYPQILIDMASTIIFKSDILTITIGSIHEFIISQVLAIIAFPIVSLLTQDSKPAESFLNKIFRIMKSSD